MERIYFSANVAAMSSDMHEILIDMFRGRPEFAAEMLGDLSVRVPAHVRAEAASGDLPDLSPTEYRADSVITFSNVDGPVFAVVIEVQLARDKRKRWSWPVYLTTLRARLRCPVALLVVSEDPGVSKWCGQPIVVGEPDFVLSPITFSTGDVPRIADPELARRHPEITVMSMLLHYDEDPERLTRALSVALDEADRISPERAKMYADLVLGSLKNSAARQFLEEALSIAAYEYKSDFARRYVAEGEARGEARGEAKSILAILEERGFTVAPETERRIRECADLDLLGVWLRRALRVASVEEVFADDRH